MPTDLSWLSYGFPFATPPTRTVENVRNAILSKLPGKSAAKIICDIYFRHAAWMYVPFFPLTFCFTSLRIHLGIRRSPKKIFMKPSFDTYMTPKLILSHNQAKTLAFSAWYWLLEFYWTLISLHIRPKPCLIIILPVQPYLLIQLWTYKLLLEYKLW